MPGSSTGAQPSRLLSGGKRGRLRSSPLTLVSGKLCYFVAKVVFAFGDAFAHLVAREPPNCNSLADGGYFLGHQFAHSFLGRLDERLIEQHKFFEELVEAAFNNLVDDLVRFVGVLRIILRLRARNLALLDRKSVV